ncbi:hypothetical protein F5Y13DRAFT_191263 [Hypoxylon sp. FL1857]|nr:hypothetical protein F5Y13DRAFT_191263 [Hypoxylon sp. FL1857]
MAQQGRIRGTHPTFIYVLPRDAELNYVSDYLIGHMPEERRKLTSMGMIDPEYPFAISTYKEFNLFVDELYETREDEPQRWPDQVTMMVDVELRASEGGELFFINLLDLIRRRSPVLNILLMSRHFSVRTASAFEKIIGQVQRIQVPNINPELTTYRTAPDNMEATTLNAVRAVMATREPDSDEPRIVIGTSDDDIVVRADFEVQFIHSMNISEPGIFHDQASGELNSVFVVDPEAVLSARLPNLKLVVTYGNSRSLLFDRVTGQLVNCTREMSLYEMELQTSWAFKTTTDPEDVRILQLMTAAKLKSLKRSKDPWGPAWNVHLSLLTLRILRMWPRRILAHLPMRQPPDRFAVSDMIHKLVIMGLAKEHYDDENRGRYSLTTMGQCALDAMNQSEVANANIHLHAAYLLATAVHNKGKLSDKVVRVLIRMAAISAVGIGAFCAINTQIQARPSLQQRLGQCAGIGRQQCRKGGLWMALGVYLKERKEGNFSARERQEPNQGSLKRDWLTIRAYSGFLISYLVARFETMASCSQDGDEIQNTMLDDDEVAVVEQHMIMAWLHRVVHIECASGNVSDVSSYQDVTIDEGSEFLDVTAEKQDRKNRKLKGFFAIYDSLQLVKKVYTASELTLIPASRFAVVKERTGMNFLTAAATTYPLHPMV